MRSLGFLALGHEACNGVWSEVEICEADSGGDVRLQHDSRDSSQTDGFADGDLESDRLRLRTVAIGRSGKSGYDVAPGGGGSTPRPSRSRWASTPNTNEDSDMAFHLICR